MHTKRIPCMALVMILLLSLLAACGREDAWVDKMVDEYKAASPVLIPSSDQAKNSFEITQRYFPTGMSNREAFRKLEALNSNGFLVQKRMATVRTDPYGRIGHDKYNETAQEKTERDRDLGPGLRGGAYRAYLRIGTDWSNPNYERALMINYVVADHSDSISHVEGGIGSYPKRRKTELECGYGDWSLAFPQPHSTTC